MHHLGLRSSRTCPGCAVAVTANGWRDRETIRRSRISFAVLATIFHATEAILKPRPVGETRRARYPGRRKHGAVVRTLRARCRCVRATPRRPPRAFAAARIRHAALPGREPRPPGVQAGADRRAVGRPAAKR